MFIFNLWGRFAYLTEGAFGLFWRASLQDEALALADLSPAIAPKWGQAQGIGPCKPVFMRDHFVIGGCARSRSISGVGAS